MQWIDSGSPPSCLDYSDFLIPSAAGVSVASNLLSAYNIQTMHAPLLMFHFLYPLRSWNHKTSHENGILYAITKFINVRL